METTKHTQRRKPPNAGKRGRIPVMPAAPLLVAATSPSPTPSQEASTTAKQKNAAMATHAGVCAVGVIAEYARTPFGEQDTDELLAQLTASMQSASDGSMSQCENMLVGQALALQSMFVHMSRRVLNQELKHYSDVNFVLAQNQCRMTLETLAEIKNPRQVAFVRQTNVAQNQQINNQPVSRTRKFVTQNRQSRLSESTHAERLEQRAPSTSEQIDSRLETVGKVNRSANVGRQSDRVAERIQGSSPGDDAQASTILTGTQKPER
jgi:hypothetical protein